MLEPRWPRLAAERRTGDDVAAMRSAIATERAARSSDAAHDASRAFHLAVAAATRNEAFVRLLDGLWIADVGRRLLAERRRAASWQDDDVEEHEAIVVALEAGTATVPPRSCGPMWRARFATGRRAPAPESLPQAGSASAIVRAVCSRSSPSASSSFACRSPEASISSVMSAPPISSPLTNTCRDRRPLAQGRQLLPDPGVGEDVDGCDRGAGLP